MRTQNIPTCVAKYADLVCSNPACKKDFRRLLIDMRKGDSYCSVQCRLDAKSVFKAGIIKVYFDGHKVNECKFDTRARLKGIMKHWEDIYAGGELSILFDES